MRRLIWVFVGRTCEKVCFLILRIKCLWQLLTSQDKYTYFTLLSLCRFKRNVSSNLHADMTKTYATRTVFFITKHWRLSAEAIKQLVRSWKRSRMTYRQQRSRSVCTTLLHFRIYKIKKFFFSEWRRPRYGICIREGSDKPALMRGLVCFFSASTAQESNFCLRYRGIKKCNDFSSKRN